MTLKTVFRLHLWLGLISGIFMFLIGMTGAVAVFIDEIDWMVTPALRARAAPDGQRASPNEVLASVREAYPDARITSLGISNRPAFAHTVSLQLKPRGSLQVFVDPVTAKIQGSRPVSAAYTSTVRNFIRQSHVRLLMGLWGRVFVGVVGVVLLLSCITGLWFYRGWIKKLFTLRIGEGWGKRPAWAELHKFIGVWSLIFNVVIGLTGAVLGLENLSGQIKRHWLRPASGEAVVAKPAAPKHTYAKGEPLTMESLLARAAQEFPDLEVRTIDLPARPNAPVSLRGDVPSLLMMQSHVRRASSLALDPVSGDLVNKVDGRDATGWRRLYFTFDPLHFGYFGGMFTKVIWFVLGLTPGVLALTGAVMWWRRKVSSTKRAEASSSPVAPRVIAAAVAVLAAVVSYVVVASDLGSAAFTHRFAEHWLVKPISLALAAFPVTGLLVWVAWRFRTRLMLFTGACAACGAWFVLLAGLFPP